MSKISHIEDKQKPKLKDLLIKYDSGNYQFQQYYDINGHLPEYMKKKIDKDMFNILMYVLEHREELMKLDV